MIIPFGITLSGIAGIAVLFIVLAVILGFGAKVTGELAEDMTTDTTVLAESITGMTNATNKSVATIGASRFTLSTAGVVLYNASNGELYAQGASGSYIAYANGVISWLNWTDPEGTRTINYTYNACTTTDCSATENGTQSLGELSSWIPTIAVIIMAAIIIGIVTTYFYARSRG